MAVNFWTREEIIARAHSREIEQADHTQTWSVLKLGEHCSVICAEIQDPKGPPLHLHRDHEGIAILLEGEGEVVVGDETRRLKPGDVYFIPKGAPHSARMSAKFLLVYSPVVDVNNIDRVILE